MLFLAAAVLLGRLSINSRRVLFVLSCVRLRLTLYTCTHYRRKCHTVCARSIHKATLYPGAWTGGIKGFISSNQISGYTPVVPIPDWHHQQRQKIEWNRHAPSRPTAWGSVVHR